jgi:acetyltransferase-like isoleucine patch superfamily enzyme
MTNLISQSLQTPWKISNLLLSRAILPWMRLVMALNDIPWRRGWSFYGLPIIQKHRQSTMSFGEGFSLRSSLASNPLGANHPVILSTLKAGAVLQIGEHFGMTGGSICAASRIEIGDHVAIGANCCIVDTDFHPLAAALRHEHPQDGQSAPITIGDQVFIGMNCLILKGVTIGKNSVIGAGSVVTKNVPENVIFAGNPAGFIRELGQAAPFLPAKEKLLA